MSFNDKNSSAIKNEFATNKKDAQAKPTGELIAGGVMMAFLTAAALYAQTPLALSGLAIMSSAYIAKIQEYRAHS